MRSTGVSKNEADPIWTAIRQEVSEQIKSEPILASFLHVTVLSHRCIEDALSFHLASQLATATLSSMLLRELIDEILVDNPGISEAVKADLMAVCDRDPASHGFANPFLYFKGFQAIQSYRIAHALWRSERQALAYYLQSRISSAFDVDIHPAARLGKGIMIDHGTGVVIGETAVIEDSVSILHEVTLGGTGKHGGDRHPKVRRGVLIGAGAKILGNIEVGEGAKIAAGSVVLKDVPAHTTVAGVPARIVGRVSVEQPALDMNQQLNAHGGGI